MTTPDELKRAVERLDFCAATGAAALAGIVTVTTDDLRAILSERAELLAAVERMRGALGGLLKMADAMTGDHVAEGVHTGLRKGSDAADAGALWKAISESETSAWSDACTFFAESMTDDFCGFGREITKARAAITNGEGK